MGEIEEQPNFRMIGLRLGEVGNCIGQLLAESYLNEGTLVRVVVFENNLRKYLMIHNIIDFVSKSLGMAYLSIISRHQDTKPELKFTNAEEHESLFTFQMIEINRLVLYHITQSAFGVIYHRE